MCSGKPGLAASQIEIKSIAAETARFLSGLAFTLRNGFPQEKLAALRQCIDRIRVDKPHRHGAVGRNGVSETPNAPAGHGGGMVGLGAALLIVFALAIVAAMLA